MLKRFLSLFLMIALMVCVLVPAATAADDEPISSGGYYYVYTPNGKGLNVRDLPNGRVVGSLKYGTKIYTYYNEGGWALIDYQYNMPGVGPGTYACYVSSRYLVRNKPAPYSPTPVTPTPVSDPFEEINQEVRSAKTVTPYWVTVRPTRASGWVNMRWAPSQQTEVMATYKAGVQLEVLRETTNWYQVMDGDTGNVGFIMKKFTSQ